MRSSPTAHYENPLYDHVVKLTVFDESYRHFVRCNHEVYDDVHPLCVQTRELSVRRKISTSDMRTPRGSLVRIFSYLSPRFFSLVRKLHDQNFTIHQSRRDGKQTQYISPAGMVSTIYQPHRDGKYNISAPQGR